MPSRRLLLIIWRKNKIREKTVVFYRISEGEIVSDATFIHLNFSFTYVTGFPNREIVDNSVRTNQHRGRILKPSAQVHFEMRMTIPSQRQGKARQKEKKLTRNFNENRIGAACASVDWPDWTAPPCAVWHLRLFLAARFICFILSVFLCFRFACLLSNIFSRYSVV